MSDEDEFKDALRDRLAAMVEIRETRGHLVQRRWRARPRNTPTMRGDVLYQDRSHPVAHVPASFWQPWPTGTRVRLVSSAGHQVVVQVRDTANN